MGTSERWERLTTDQAAGRLGISVDAVRGRIKRGTLEHEREGNKVYVLLEATTTSEQPTDDQPTDQSELVAQLRGEVVYLRDMLRREQEINALHASNMRALGSLPPAAEPEEPIETEEEPPEDAGGSENQSSRPWWAFWR